MSSHPSPRNRHKPTTNSTSRPHHNIETHRCQSLRLPPPFKLMTHQRLQVVTGNTRRCSIEQAKVLNTKCTITSRNFELYEIPENIAQVDMTLYRQKLWANSPDSFRTRRNGHNMHSNVVFVRHKIEAINFGVRHRPRTPNWMVSPWRWSRHRQ